MKKNNFAEEYAREAAIKAQYHEAEKAGSTEGQEAARNAYHELEGQIRAKGDSYARTYQLYSEARERATSTLI